MFKANRVSSVVNVFIYPLAVVRSCTALTLFPSNERRTFNDPLNSFTVVTINVANIEKHANNGRKLKKKGSVEVQMNRVTFHRSFARHVPRDLGSHANTEFNGSRPVHAAPDKFENAVLFLRLGLPSTLIQTENGAF